MLIVLLAAVQLAQVFTEWIVVLVIVLHVHLAKFKNQEILTSAKNVPMPCRIVKNVQITRPALLVILHTSLPQPIDATLAVTS